MLKGIQTLLQKDTKGVVILMQFGYERSCARKRQNGMITKGIVNSRQYGCYSDKAVYRSWVVANTAHPLGPIRDNRMGLSTEK